MKKTLDQRVEDHRVMMLGDSERPDDRDRLIADLWLALKNKPVWEKPVPE